MKNPPIVNKSGIMFFAAAMLGTATQAAPASDQSVVEAQVVSLADFIGDWESDGPAFGQAAHSIMKWETVLDGKFIRLSYTIQTGGEKDPKNFFSGIGYYKQSQQGRTTAFWADSGGELHPITAKMTHDTLKSTWGAAGGKLGRTYYRLTKDGTIEVTDWLLTEKGWRQFNQNIFTRGS